LPVGINPAVEVPEDESLKVKFCLRMFFTDELMRTVAEWTNIKEEVRWREVHEQLGQGDVGDELPAHRRWIPCTADDVKKTVGMILCTGMYKKPELSMYWSTDPFDGAAHFQNPFALPRDRFQAVVSNMRFYNCAQQDGEDAARKIRPFLDMVQEICQRNYTPRKQLSADEELILYKGRLAFKQYIPTKRARFGIKVCVSRSLNICTAFCCTRLLRTTASSVKESKASNTCHSVSGQLWS
jgi:hypothetical protein